MRLIVSYFFSALVSLITSVVFCCRQVHSVKKEGLSRLFETFAKNDGLKNHTDALTNGPTRGSHEHDAMPTSRAPASTVSRDTSAIAAALSDKENVEDLMATVDDSDPMAEMLENHALKLAEEGTWARIHRSSIAMRRAFAGTFLEWLLFCGHARSKSWRAIFH